MQDLQSLSFATCKFSSAKGHTDFSVLKKNRINILPVSYEKRKLSPCEACRWWG